MFAFNDAVAAFKLLKFSESHPVNVKSKYNDKNTLYEFHAVKTV